MRVCVVTYFMTIGIFTLNKLRVAFGFLPSPNAVRIEEYLNYFTFDYADPTGDHTVAITGEVGECPWNPEHKLIRL